MSREQKKHTPALDVGSDDKAPQVPQASIEDSQSAAAAILDFANTGKGDAKEIPRLLKLLSDEGRAALATRMPDIAAHMSGDQFLQCAEAFGYVSHFAIDVALDTSKPAATDKAVRRYLQSRNAEQAAELGENEPVVAKVRKLMRGSLIRELPVLAEIPGAMRIHPSLIKWFIETTDPLVAAVHLAQAGSPELAASLDKLDQWSWLSRLKIADGALLGPGLKRLGAATKNANAKTTIEGMTKHVLADGDVTEEAQTKARQALYATDKTTSVEATLDLTARGNYVEDSHEKALLQRMAGQPASDVVQFALASRIDLVDVLPTVLDAPGLNAEQLLTVIRTTGTVDNRMKMLKDDRLRRRIRNVIGRSAPLTELFPENFEYVHPHVVGDEALRQWIYDSKDPRSLLWLAATDSTGIKKAISLVRSEYGLDWILGLPADADRASLRRLALYVTDAKYSKHLKWLIADKRFHAEKGEWEAETIDPDVLGTGDVGKQLEAVSKAKKDPDSVSEDELVGRIIDLEPAERTRIAKDPSQLSSTLKGLASDALVRAVYALSPTLSQLLTAGLGFEPQLLTYVRTRPAGEERDAAKHANLTTAAAAMFLGISAFTVFPSMTDPKVAGAALASNPSLLGWIFDTAEPNQVLAVLSREPARQHVVDALASNEELYKRFPKYKSLMPDAKAGFDAIAKTVDADDEDARDEASDYQHGKIRPDQSVSDKGTQIHNAADGARLWDAIDRLGAKFDMTTGLSLIRTYPGDQLELLSGAHPKQVAALREFVYLPPQHVFPHLTIAQLLAAPDAARWLFEAETSFMVLVQVSGNAAAIKQLGKLINSGQHGANTWLDVLQGGALLEPIERNVIDQLSEHVTSPEVIRKLFSIRFGVSMTDTFDTPHAKKLWTTLKRLPPAQVNQQAVNEFTIKASPGAAGYWSDPNIVISNDETDFVRPNEKGEAAEVMDTTYDNATLMSEAEMKRGFGFDDATWAKAIDPVTGWVEKVGSQFRMKKIEFSKFDSTVLHEVGHSIDTLLGERTDLVFSLGGWKNYGIDDVEQWADDMHALDGVRGADRAKIVEAWKQAFHAGTSVRSMVDDDHPAVSSRYKDVPLVAAGRDGSDFSHKEKRAVGGRVGLTGNNQGTIAHVPKMTADTAPSEYSLSAPGEFFAECYAEYYRGFTGANPEAKGGKLARWIKEWFDHNVDKIELNPQRYLKKPANAAGAASPQRDATAKS